MPAAYAKTDGMMIIHGREHRLPELPHFSVDGYCLETYIIYEFLGC